MVMCGLVFWPAIAQATLITIEIEGVVDFVDDPYGYLEGQVNPGDTITGFYIYESTTPDSEPLPTLGRYEHSTPPHGIFISLGGFDFETDPANVDFLVEVADNYSSTDNYLLRSYNNIPLSNGTLVDHISWQLDDPTNTALSSDALPTTPPALDDWQFNHLRLHGERGGYIIDAQVTSAIPEPASISILCLGGLLLRKRR